MEKNFKNRKISENDFKNRLNLNILIILKYLIRKNY